MPIFSIRFFFQSAPQNNASNSVLCCLGHDRIAELLILNGANPDLVNQYGHSALHRAVVKGNKQCQLHIKSVFNHHLNSAENEKIVDKLLKAGANVNLVDDKNRTALHLSAMKGNNTFKRQLLVNPTSIKTQIP